MKKVLFMMSVLLSLGMLYACNNEDEISTRSTDDNVTLIPIEEGDGFAAISDFFKMTFATEEIKEKAFDFKNNLCNDGINACILINNEEEFKSVYMGDSPLPAIDFSKYSLIIGKVYISAGTFIDNMSIRQINNTKSILTLNYMIDTKGCYVGAVYYEYYWSLFPKFHASEVVIEKTEEYSGSLYYDKDHGGWYVSCHRPGTYDSVDIYYVLNLPEEFKANKEEWVDVSFSGKVVEMTDKDRESLRLWLLGGYRYFYISLTKIKPSAFDISEECRPFDRLEKSFACNAPNPHMYGRQRAHSKRKALPCK